MVFDWRAWLAIQWSSRTEGRSAGSVLIDGRFCIDGAPPRFRPRGRAATYAKDCLMTRIDTLEPQHLWNHFDRIRQCRGPRATRRKSASTCWRGRASADFGTSVDKAGNMVVSVPASKGHEKRAGAGAAGAHGHGVREERRRVLRLLARRDPARARRRLAQRERHHARCRQRHRVSPRRSRSPTIPRWCTGRSSSSSPWTRRPVSPVRPARRIPW